MEGSGRPILDAVFDADANYVYVVPVVVVPEANEPYEAAAKLHLLDSGNPPYELVQLYADVPPDGDNQYLDNLREIEIDDAGNLYVINADSLNESDILWVFGSQTGKVAKLSLGKPDGNCYIPAPTALHFSETTGLLYLASSLQQPDANSVLLYALSTTANRIIKTIRINGMGHITGITEDPDSGTLWVVGFTMPDIPEYIDSDPLSEPFYRPYLAKIPRGAAGPVDANCLYDPVAHPDNDLALPISVLWTGIKEDKCPLANIDGSGRVNFADIALLAEHWLQSGCGYPDDWCGGTDITLDNKVNGDDLWFDRLTIPSGVEGLAIIRCWLWTEQ